MTLLSIIQSMADTLALERPMSVVGSSDGIAREMLGALNDAGRAMARENDPAFAGLTRFASFVSTDTFFQADLKDIAPDYGFMVNDTLWDVNSVWPTDGAITPQQWGLLKVRGGFAPYGKFRILVNPDTNNLALYVDPAPAAGNTCTFEYISSMWVISPTLNPSTSLYTWSSFQSDNDNTFFDEEALKQQAVWRFKRVKGIEDWPAWKADADAYMSTVKTQEVGTSSFYVGTRGGIHLLNYMNIQDGNYPSGI